MSASMNQDYKERWSSYIWDRLEDFSVPVLMIFVVEFALVFWVLSPYIPGPFLEETPYIIIVIALLIGLAVLVTWTLQTRTSILKVRNRVEINPTEIHLPYIVKKRESIMLDEIASVDIEYQDEKLLLRNEPQLWWKCTFTTRSGEKIVLARSNPGCYDMACLSAIEMIAQRVKHRSPPPR